jgi:NarL family two-component system response regulator LiaR
VARRQERVQGMEERVTETQGPVVRLLIADDHRVVREGLALMLALDADLVAVGEAADGAEAVRLARQLRPDLVLMDLAMPVLDGIAATAIIRRELPETEVLVLTSLLQDHAVVGAIRAGAIGYLHKDTPGAEVLRAIKAAAAGQVQLSPAAMQWLVREMEGGQGAAAAPSLTPREQDVLRLLARGLTTRAIAAALSVGENTVKTHTRTLLAKLGAHSRTQAVLEAQRLGLVPAPSSEIDR